MNLLSVIETIVFLVLAILLILLLNKKIKLGSQKVVYITLILLPSILLSFSIICCLYRLQLLNQALTLLEILLIPLIIVELIILIILILADCVSKLYFNKFIRSENNSKELLLINAHKLLSYSLTASLSYYLFFPIYCFISFFQLFVLVMLYQVFLLFLSVILFFTFNIIMLIILHFMASCGFKILAQVLEKPQKSYTKYYLLLLIPIYNIFVIKKIKKMVEFELENIDIFIKINNKIFGGYSLK